MLSDNVGQQEQQISRMKAIFTPFPACCGSCAVIAI